MRRERPTRDTAAARDGEPTCRTQQEGGSSASDSAPRSRWGITLLAGAVCQVLVILWIVFSEVPGKVFISSWSIVMPGILLLTVFLALSRLMPHALTRRRLLLIYAMLSASSCLVGYGAIQAMFPAVATQFYNASASNSWGSFNVFVPRWLVPRSPEVLKGLYVGHSHVPWGAWLVPLAAWGLLMLLTAFSMLSLAVLLSEVWIRHERLTFPIVALPLEMTGDGTRFFSQRSLWLGILIPVVLESLLALQYYFPAVPALAMKHVDYSGQFTARPWSALSPFYMGFTPFIVGFAYLAPTDISLSVWFFGILDRLIQVATVMAGGDPASLGAYIKQPPFSQQQTLGAFLMIAIAPLLRALPRIRSRLKTPEGRPEREALGLLSVSFLGLLAFLMAVGLSWWVSLAFGLLLLLFALALARLRAEAGPVWAFGPYGGLSGNMVNVAGSSSFSAPELANLSTLQWMAADMRFLPMAFHIESLKIADSAGISRRVMMLALALATALGIVTGMAAVLWMEYQLGVATGKVYGGVSYWQTLVTNRSTQWTNNRTLPDSLGVTWIVLGAAITWGLGFLRQSFLWWPLHPVGYVLAHTGTGVSFWLHYFIAWVAKTLVLRYGGMALYRRSIPFVVGLILGDLLTMTVWSAGAVLLGAPVYQFIS